MDIYRNKIVSILANHLAMDGQEITGWMETPPRPELGDYAFPCFRLAKHFRKSPVAIAAELCTALAPAIAQSGEFEAPRCEGPYINVTVRSAHLAGHVVKAALCGSHGFSALSDRGEIVIVEYSSPNIARPLSIGHLRSTVIGNSLIRLFRHAGYRTVGINYLGDWGTQFGKLLVAYRSWYEGSEEDVTVPVLLELYVRFHQEARERPELDDQAREAFRELEEGDDESLRLWKLFREVSLEGMVPLYDRLSVQFEDMSGESFYNDSSKDMIERVIASGLSEESDGALIVHTSEKNLGPFQLRKSDGTTLYSTRDLAALFDRIERYKPVKILYVVGSEQRDHFRKLFEVATKMGIPPGVEALHVPFGMYRMGSLKKSTRAGRILFMEDVLDKAVELARTLVEEKNPSLPGKDAVAAAVGVGAIIFADLASDREKNIDFDWDTILNFDGETGPYVQYAHARACSVLARAGVASNIEIPSNVETLAAALSGAEEQVLIRALHRFPAAVLSGVDSFRPSSVTQSLLLIARAFSRFYHNCPVIQATGDQRTARLLLTRAVKTVLHYGLSLLGMQAPSSM